MARECRKRSMVMALLLVRCPGIGMKRKSRILAAHNLLQRVGK